MMTYIHVWATYAYTGQCDLNHNNYRNYCRIFVLIDSVICSKGVMT